MIKLSSEMSIAREFCMTSFYCFGEAVAAEEFYLFSSKGEAKG